MQKHVKTVTAGIRRIYIYQLALDGVTCYVLARTTARVCLRNTAIYTRFSSLRQAERIARTLC